MKMPPRFVTPLMNTVLSIVQRCASARQPMPTNNDLGTLASNRGRQSVAKALQKLEAQGKIRVEIRRGRRRVYVVGLRRLTGWGDHRIGHAPYCANPKGSFGSVEVAKPSPAKPIGRAGGFQFLGVSVSELAEYERIVLENDKPVGAMPRCQFICDDNGLVTFCNAKSIRNESWCEAHHSLVFVRSRNPRTCVFVT